MYADRRCRIQPLPKSHHFALRAEALVRLGDRYGAIADILDALALSPEDLQANRRLLAWGNDQQKRIAAEVLVRSDDDAALLTQALAVLRDAGRDAVGALRAFDDTLSGWAVWDGAVAPVLTVRDGEAHESRALISDGSHPLAGGVFQHAAAFNGPRRASATGHKVSLDLNGHCFLTEQCPANAVHDPRPGDLKPGSSPQSTAVTVIVPVYRDLAATRDCLVSLAFNIGGKGKRRAIVVNDATPEPELARFLEQFCGEAGFMLLTNARNLGFVGSVNRALALAENDDVVLLNADTIVPPGFVDRMVDIAASDPAIGTITPLSNNGEFTSFPRPFECNPFPSHEQILQIDRLAASINRDRIVDLPNGIGFCMFVARRCLDAIGNLSDAYQRGYLEDVDLCLRAREHGFRNVCAPSIFVGHHGSKSFGAEKRSLVMRNVAIVEAKFPDYRLECALFMAADPLRTARESIAKQISPGDVDCLHLCGEGMLKDVALERARKLHSEGKISLVMSVGLRGGKTIASIWRPDHESRPSLAFDIDRAFDSADLRKYLFSSSFRRTEIIEPGAIPSKLMELIGEFRRPLEIVAADAGVLCPRGTCFKPDGQFCTSLNTEKICVECAPRCKTALPAGASPDDWRKHWKAIIASGVDLPCDDAKAFGRALLSPDKLATMLAPRNMRAAIPSLRGGRIGLVVHGRSAEEFELTREFLRTAVRTSPTQDFVVLGVTADDIALMAIGNAFVSGSLKIADYAATLQRYAIKRIFLPLRRPLFGHPVGLAIRELELPMAYFDWSLGHRKPREVDLAIDPRTSIADVISIVGRWGGF